jgi:DNA-binding NarL/FixJ family response regulator
MGNHDPARRILIVGIGSLLEEGVESLLAQEPNVQVWAIHHEDEDALIQYAARLHPDVILFHEMGALDADRIFDLVRTIPVEPLRVVILRSSDSAVDLYEKRRVYTADGGNFRDLILGNQRAEAH